MVCGRVLSNPRRLLAEKVSAVLMSLLSLKHNKLAQVMILSLFLSLCVFLSLSAIGL